SGLQFSSLRNVQLQTSGDNPNISNGGGPVVSTGNGSEDAIQTINLPTGYGAAQLVWHSSASNTWVRAPILQSGSGNPANVVGCWQVGDLYERLDTANTGTGNVEISQCSVAGSPAGTVANSQWITLRDRAFQVKDYITSASTTAGFAEAIAAATSTAEGGGIVIVPPGGTGRINSTVTVPQNVQIVGHGWKDFVTCNAGITCFQMNGSNIGANRLSNFTIGFSASNTSNV